MVLCPIFLIESLQCIALVVKLKLKKDVVSLSLSVCLYQNHVSVCSVRATYMTHHKMTKYEYRTCMLSFVACFVCLCTRYKEVCWSSTMTTVVSFC